MPHFIKFDHQGTAFRFGLLGVDFGELLDPGHHARRGHAQQLGRAVHRQAAQVEERRRDLDPARHAARRRVGEVQPARLAAVALLAPHQAVPDVLPAPAPLAPQPHRSTPPAIPPPTDIGNLRRPKTLLDPNGDFGNFHAPQDSSFWAKENFHADFASTKRKTPAGISSYDSEAEFEGAWYDIPFQFVSSTKGDRRPYREGANAAPLKLHWKWLPRAEQDFLLHI